MYAEAFLSPRKTPLANESTTKRKKSLRGYAIRLKVEGEDSIINIVPQYPVKAELHTRSYEANPERLTCEIGDGYLVFYKDTRKGFILDKNQIISAHIDYWHLKKAFYGISGILKALKNENPKRNVVRKHIKKRKRGLSEDDKKQIQDRVGKVMEKCL